ncbi:hypothetical protein O181_057782 [Austropuccinia psidii MF-1]|uniref:Uncharacterized protein n=1 Tax=Austropuccinia psidii MF-1 TaxID=1389203 RepID=A0A9Q3HVS7_9BASI|nr:hypothetical protein [Austropuccinia psidii MF-1]
MPVQHNHPAKNNGSQRNQAVLTPTARACLDHTPSVCQLSANLDREPPFEGAETPEEEVLIVEDQNHSMARWVAILTYSKGLEVDLGKLKMKRGRRRLKWKMPWNVPLRLLSL